MKNYQKIIDYLGKCIENDRLAHAYIFYGYDETAKKNIALEFAGKILNSKAGFHPDLMLISTNIGEELHINLIRQLKKFLFLSPYSGKYKIAIIEKAEKLNLYAQNAILKIFEEAPHRSIIILCVKTIDSISETVASRGVKLPFWQKTDHDDSINEKTLKVFNAMLDSSFKKQYRDIEKLSDFKAVEIFKIWLEFLRNKFLSDPSKKLTSILKVSQNIYFKLNETNINPKLAYDELILNLWKF